MNDNGEIALRTTKAGTVVYTWVPEWLQQRIRTRATKHGPYIFGAHKTTTLDIITEAWRRRLNKIWEMCGEWKIADASPISAYFCPDTLTETGRHRARCRALRQYGRDGA
jgi:hypothetical protein